MRRILAALTLLSVVALWSGCGGSDKTANSNAGVTSNTGTTVYEGNTSPATSAPSGGGMSNSAAPTSTPPRIKPPTDK